VVTLRYAATVDEGAPNEEGNRGCGEINGSAEVVLLEPIAQSLRLPLYRETPRCTAR
jgi:hypothetical protein